MRTVAETDHKQYMMDLIQKVLKKQPDEKIIVVSQWTACLKLVSDYLTEKGIVHVMLVFGLFLFQLVNADALLHRYQGDMNRDKRDKSVRTFMSKDKASVMLMSLKCGGTLSYAILFFCRLTSP